MPATRQEIEQAMQGLEQKIGKIREKVTEVDDQIKTTSVDSVEKVEGELEQLRNRYYEIQARELIGEFDDKQKREVEDNIQAAERKLKAETTDYRISSVSVMRWSLNSRRPRRRLSNPRRPSSAWNSRT